jgi:hypothetical protein
MYYYLVIPFFLAWYFYPRPKPIQEIRYENLYGFGVKKEQLIETSENIDKQRVEEETPDGKTVLQWDDDHFIYWSDKKISYKYLETLARKYVILYDCRDKYINVYKELYQAHLKSEKEILPVPQDSVFVKAKPVVQRKTGLVPEKSNVYIWKGKLSELVPKEQPVFKQIKFSDFKSIHNS